jgi:hypothetical protein
MMRATARRRLSWGVGGLTLCLGAAVFAEAWPDARDSTGGADLPAVGLPVAAALAPDAPPLDDWVNTALGRPLFAPDRRPDAAAAAPDGEMPRLSGIIRLAGSSLAMFQSESGDGAGRSVLVAEGAKVSGWTITGITDGTVTLVRDGQIATLRLRYANLPVAARRLGKGPVTVLHDKRSNAFLQP